MECNVVQLVGFAVVEDDVFRCCGGVAESVAYVEAEAVAVDIGVAGAPEPRVVVCPYAAAPVKGAEVGLGVELVVLAVEFHPAACAHAVDLLVVVEVAFLVPRGGYHKAVHVRLLKADVALEFLSVHEVVKTAFNGASAFLHIKTHLKALVFISCGAGGGIGGKSDLAHREGVEHCLRMLPRLFPECQKRYRLKPDVAVVRDGEGSCKAVAQDKVVVPLLDAPFGGLYHLPVVFLDHSAGPAGLAEVSVFIQQHLNCGYFMVSAHDLMIARIMILAHIIR